MERISKTLKLNDIEVLYKKLNNNNEPFDILLPNFINSIDFGVTTFLIQFINSWLRLRPGKLLLETKDDYSDLADVISNDYVFPSVVMCWDKGVFDKNGKNIKNLVKPINESIVDSMQSLENFPLLNKTFKRQKGFKSLLTCFDHLPPEKGYLDCFYLNKQFIFSEEFLNNSLEDTLNYVLSFNSKGRKNIKPIKADLISIIYELMKNTHEWARTDNNSKVLNPNTRGLLLKFVKKTKENYILNYQNHLGLKNYFDSFSTNDINELYFLEISVFDSGIGMINKYSSSDDFIEINEQIQVIKDCLIKNNTSEKSIEKDFKGIGLDKIMQVLNNKGLFIIRTSNAFVFRNMKKDPYVQTSDRSKIELFDWNTSLNSSFTKFEKCTGTNITIVYPIILD